VRFLWEMKKDKEAWRDLREGAYMLRTNLQADSAEQMWSMYMQLTEAEASFRALKSELSIRPLFHQKEARVKAHVLVAFLGYALWVTLKHLLWRRPATVPQSSANGVDNAQPFSPMKALALLSTLQSADIVLPTTDGREIRLRRITEPTTEQKSLLHQLGLAGVYWELREQACKQIFVRELEALRRITHVGYYEAMAARPRVLTKACWARDCCEST
jgi:hypothetical protein